MIDAGWLRALGEDGLKALLERRPDAVSPPAPASLTELAERLSQPNAVLAGLRRLDRPTLQVAEALAALGGEADRANLGRLLSPAGLTRPPGTRLPTSADLDRALDMLRDHALLAGHDRPRLVDAARAAWANPLGLGAPAAEVIRHRTADELRAYARNLGLKPAGRKADLLAQVLGALRDPELVRRVVAGGPADSRELLLKVALTGEPVNDLDYFSPVYGQPKGPRQWAIARGLLIRAGNWDAGLVMPAEAALALRGPDWRAPFDPVAPRPATRPVASAAVARDAAAAGSAALRLVSALLDEAGRTAIAVLKAGGVGTRELRRLVKRIGCAEPEVRLGLAVAHGAGLLALSAAGGTPTTGYDDWLRAEPAHRLAVLMDAWWSLPYVPTEESDAAWVPTSRGDGTANLRAALLGEAAALAVSSEAGAPAVADQAVAVADPATLADLMLWRCPYAFAGPDPQRRAVACWREAALLGAVGADALSPAGRALRDGGDVIAALADLGTTERSVRIQADLTAVVAGTPSAELAELLDEAADRESRGAASTWRFTPASVRRALDAGQSADTLLTELAAVATGGLPQPLEYLVRDVARRHGAVRGQDVACCLRADDPALLAEIAADRRLRNLGLRALAPTVLAGAKPLAETLAGLRLAGYAPLAESADGTAVLERMQPRRAAAPAKARRRTAGPPAKVGGRAKAPDPNSLARALLGKPDVVAVPSSPALKAVRTAARYLTESQARVLAHAIDANLPVSIEYVNQAGNVSSRVISDISLTGGTMLAWCGLRDDERMFNLSRVLSIGPADMD